MTEVLQWLLLGIFFPCSASAFHLAAYSSIYTGRIPQTYKMATAVVYTCATHAFAGYMFHASPTHALGVCSNSTPLREGTEGKVKAVPLMQWLKAQGAVIDGVSLETSPIGADAGLGVVATKRLEIGHQALNVPLRAQLRVDSEGLHPVSMELAEQAAGLFHGSTNAAVAKKFEEGALAAALLSELSLLRDGSCKWSRQEGATMKQPDLASSYYQEFLVSLPPVADISGAAWMWPAANLGKHPAKDLVKDAKALRSQIDTEFELLTSAGMTQLASGEVMTAELWNYARAQIMSRSFDVGTGLAMIPGIDKVNHDGEALLELFVDEEGQEGGGAGSAVLLVDRDLEAGEEVFLKYGDKTNHDLLLFYGFTLDSDHRATPLSIEE